MRRKIIALFIGSVAVMVMLSHGMMQNVGGWPMYEHIVQKGLQETGAPNLVTAIYLNYRYYDTLFEALMLLFSIIAVIYMSVHEGSEHYE